MPKLQVFDPAMCCSSGVCGPSVDPALPRFAADLEWLKSKGLEVERYNLAQEVAAFTSNLVVKQTLNSKGSKCLPLVLLDGTIVSEATYPTREELAKLAHVEFEPGPVITQTKAPQPFVTIGAPGKSGGSCAMKVPHDLTRNLLFTGKGGVGKTSIACAMAVSLAEKGKRVLLVSTDPASNLDEVLETRLGITPTLIAGTTDLYAMNLDPEEAARLYRERVVGPYRELLPKSAVDSIEEQLSGACTVEIAAFDEFAKLLGDQAATAEFDTSSSTLLPLATP